MEYSDLVYACRLGFIFAHNCRKARKLIEEFHSPEELFLLSRPLLEKIFGAGSHYIEEILDKEALKRCEKEAEWADKHEVQILYIKDTNYPSRLKECEDAPIVLYYRGNANLEAEKMVSIVGTRKATPYGKFACKEIVEALSFVDPKPIIISGLAYGIDITAHKCAIDKGFQTIGIMGTGIDSIYPIQHRETAIEMIGKGGIISDLPKGSPPIPLNFIRRNRIIAGLSDACILIESKEKGGGMITAKMANSYSREVFALPGRINDIYSSGCNLLIHDNLASIIHSPSTITSQMNWENNSKIKINPRPLLFDSDSVIKRKILVSLASELSLDINSLLDIIDCPISEMTSTLTELEIEGRIISDINGHFSIK